MNNPVVLVGIGEVGGVFARGILRCGHPVIPVTRDSDINQIAASYPAPQLVLVSVAENDLHDTLQCLPDSWRQRVGLLQNELLPRDWQRHGIENPSVISVWFEKKKGQDVKVLLPSPAYGPQAGLLVAALTTLSIPARIVANADDLSFELVRKNLYILTTNICGLLSGGNVHDLWHEHRQLAQQVADEVIDIQEALSGIRFERSRLIAGLVEGIEADPQHMCMGRSAPGRLARALQHADEAALAVPKLREIYAATRKS